MSRIVIVGAGPAGLTLSLLLAKANIPSLVLEKEPQPADDTRAVFYNAVTQFEFKRAGIYDDVMDRGFAVRAAAFRDLTGKRLFTMPGAGQVALIQNELTSIIEKHAKQTGQTEILWNHEVTGLGQDDESAWVDVQTPQRSKRIHARYVVGCDGGLSAVRRHLFGPDAMVGFTWEKRLVAADISYNLRDHLPDAEDSNIFMHEENAWLAFRPKKNDTNYWRIIYRDADDLTDEEYVQRAAEKLKELLPGHPTQEMYKALQVRPYRVHQRVVDKMRQGRFILAGDAAHLCSPTGALGLNGAIADVGSLYDCLEAIHQGKAKDDILDVYCQVRREKFKTMIDPQSQGMMKTIFSNPEAVVPNHPMYKFSQLMEKDPELAKKNMPDPLALRYDFSTHMSS